MNADNPAQPWYREPWPWILMAGPAAVVVAGVATAWIAFANPDPLVVKNYYRHGIEINAALKREQERRRAEAAQQERRRAEQGRQ